MKKLLFLAAALSAACAASAQGYYTDAYNPDITRHTGRIAAQRAEFILPEVNGYTVYKADLHTHSVYSDGDCTPEFRVREAWYDGLDVLAITEHVEYRRHEGKMLNFLKGYVPEGTEAINNNIIRRSADERGIQSDLNLPVKLARETARKYGLTIIPGAEITREPIAYGHYNALFTTDNNSLYATDALQSLRNAKAQGALVMHNHPGWRRKSLEHPEFEVKAYGEGLIDGIEIMNGAEFYPKAIARAHARKLFVSANTDIHDATAETYRLQGHSRNMTLIFARNNSLEALREALEARRTLAYSFGTIAGDEQLLKDLFTASVRTKVLHTDPSNGRRTVSLTNSSSVEYVLRFPGQNPVVLKPFSTLMTTVGRDRRKHVVLREGSSPDRDQSVIPHPLKNPRTVDGRGFPCPPQRCSKTGRMRPEQTFFVYLQHITKRHEPVNHQQFQRIRPAHRSGAGCFRLPDDHAGADRPFRRRHARPPVDSRGHGARPDGKPL